MYTSKLETVYQKKKRNRYARHELERLTTLQLREICFQEKLVKGIANSLDRERFIETILHFRGLNDDFIIKEHQPDGVAALKKLVKHHLGKELTPASEILNPAKLTIYRGLAVEKRDQYLVETDGNTLHPSNVLLVNDQRELCGIFHIMPMDEAGKQFALCMVSGIPIEEASSKVYHLLYFNPLETEYLFDVYNKNQRILETSVNYYSVPLLDLEVVDLPATVQILAIDFGTSNSTAGLYISKDYQELVNEHDLLNNHLQLDQINYVNFEIDSQAEAWSTLLPTAVSVADCSDPTNIQFLFGHQALAQDQSIVGDERFGTTFYELKRWVQGYYQQEELVDLQGNTAIVSRSVIIQAFIRYIISHAQQQFKCRFQHLHVSSPVKMKHQFLTMFNELFPDYEIEETQSLDEGIAVLYNTIAKQIQQQSFQHGAEYQALVFDCGGGTTDLSSCKFSIEDQRVSYHVAVETNFENGDVNFGGNNLTYRILQLLKIRFVEYYQKEIPQSIDVLLPNVVSDVYRFIDEQGHEAVYQTLNQKYLEAEALLPTQFQAYRNQSYPLFKRVQKNYYLLWTIAETVKKAFYEHTDTWQLSIAPTEYSFIQAVLEQVKTFKLTLIRQGQMVYEYQTPQLVINRYEVDGVLRGDIYSIVKKFFEDLYQQGTLQDYAIIKMTGQSCKIPLFREAIKEYIAGKNIEFRQKENPLMDLKLSCLGGSIHYLEDCKTGVIRSTLTNAVPDIPYTIYAYDHRGDVRELLLRNDKITQSSGFISKAATTKELTFYLESEGQVQHTSFLYTNQQGLYQPVTYEKINADYTQFIRQDDVDNIEDDEVKFFVYANEKSWGFYVLPIARRNGELYQGTEQFFAFENEQWEINFFDGKK